MYIKIKQKFYYSEIIIQFRKKNIYQELKNSDTKRVVIKSTI